MLIQGAPVSSDAVISADNIADGAIIGWLTHDADSCCQQLRSQLALQLATSNSAQSQSVNSSVALSQVSAQYHIQALADPIAVALGPDDNAVLPGSMSGSPDWFNRFDLQSAYQQRASMSRDKKVFEGDAVRSAQGGCWGPPPPPQYPAMLRGELALAVMSGVTGKSLVKEVCYLVTRST